jgi:SAM-dependent methyltransferase
VASEGGLTGAVLDAGCGTGEHALLAASLGLEVLGVDLAATAIERARAKASDRGLDATFAVADAFDLDRLQRSFDTVLDCGLFHTCDENERSRYVASVASVTKRDGTLYVLCFSDGAPDIGPHPVRQEELRASFSEQDGWNVDRVEPALIQTTFIEQGVPAWFATMTRL